MGWGRGTVPGLGCGAPSTRCGQRAPVTRFPQGPQEAAGDRKPHSEFPGVKGVRAAPCCTAGARGAGPGWCPGCPPMLAPGLPFGLGSKAGETS